MLLLQEQGREVGLLLRLTRALFLVYTLTITEQFELTWPPENAKLTLVSLYYCFLSPDLYEGEGVHFIPIETIQILGHLQNEHLKMLPSGPAMFIIVELWVSKIWMECSGHAVTGFLLSTSPLTLSFHYWCPCVEGCLGEDSGPSLVLEELVQRLAWEIRIVNKCCSNDKCCSTYHDNSMGRNITLPCGGCYSENRGFPIRCKRDYFAKIYFLLFSPFSFLALGFELRASYMLSRHFTSELHFSPLFPNFK